MIAVYALHKRIIFLCLSMIPSNGWLPSGVEPVGVPPPSGTDLECSPRVPFSGPGPFPAVLDLWGMGGGLSEYRAALLASQGMASFALAYFGHPDIPGPLNVVNVGDDYFQVKLSFSKQF